MQVQMKDNLIVRYQQCKEFDYRNHPNMGDLPINELQFVKQYYGYQDYFKLKLFLKSIENKVIDVTMIHGDAFEKLDDNYWLPNELWTKL